MIFGKRQESFLGKSPERNYPETSSLVDGLHSAADYSSSTVVSSLDRGSEEANI